MSIKEKIKKLAALAAALALTAGAVLSLSSCSVINGFVEGFKEGFNAAMGGNSTPEETPEETPAETPSGSEGGTTVEMPDFDFMSEDLSAYLTLGQYKDLDIEIPIMATVTDENVTDQINYDLINSEIYETVTDRAVTEKDVIYIQYRGIMDGEEFDGGTGEKDFFTMYDGGGFIDGFANGIIGATPGTEVAVDLTFPEDYYKEVAGKPVTFMVTVVHIYEAKELTDAVAAELTGNSDMTVEGLIADYRVKMEESVRESYEEYKINMTWEKIFSNAKEIEMPTELVKSYYNIDVQYYSTYASMYGISYEEILEMIGMTDDEVYARAHDNVFTDMVVYSVIRAENFSITDEDYEELLDELVESSGYTKSEILASYPKEDLVDMFTYTKIYEDAASWQNYIIVESEEG